MKARCLDDRTLTELAARFGTPLYVYSGDVMVRRARELLDARAGERRFDVVRFAQKANPNLAVLRLLRAQGLAVDAVSAGELHRAFAAGFDPREVTFCADVFDEEALDLLTRHPVQLNAGSSDMLARYARTNPPRRDVSLRINPGFGHGHDPKVTTGGELSKHGIWHADLPAVAALSRELNLRVTGLHVHIGSGSDLENLSRSCAALERAAELFGDSLESLSTGGGLPIPYRADAPRFDVSTFLETWNAARERIERSCGRTLRLEVEPGRFLVAEAGLLLARVRGLKHSGASEFVFVDAGFHNLIRPAFYGAYHELSFVGRDGEPRVPLLVAGPLCESADVFTQGKNGRFEPRDLPRPEVGDLLCIHDAGAYAASMASGYNSQLLAAEVLVHNGQARLARPRQTYTDLLAPEIRCLD